MNHNFSTVALSRLAVVRTWLTHHLQSFYMSLSPLQRASFLLGIMPMPIYVFTGQFFLLLDAIRATVVGDVIDVPVFIVLLAETLLLIYAVALVIQYAASVPAKVNERLRAAITEPHPCIVIRPVPLHLYHEERKSSLTDEADLMRGLSDMDSKDPSFMDQLPQVLEVLNNNAALVDIYEQSHPMEEVPLPITTKPKTLLDILHEKQRPSLATADDIENIIHSTNS